MGPYNYWNQIRKRIIVFDSTNNIFLKNILALGVTPRERFVGASSALSSTRSGYKRDCCDQIIQMNEFDILEKLLFE